MRRVLGMVAKLALAGALLVTAGCGTGAPAGNNEGLTTLRISATSVDSLPFMAILQVAAERGWFQAEGLNVSFISGSGGGNTLRTVTTGDADVAIAGGPAVVEAAKQNPDSLTLVGSWFQVNDFYFIGPKPVSTLDGARLGVTGAGSTTQLLATYMEKTRLPGIEVVELGGGMGDAWAAARSGSVTAGWAMHPFVTQKATKQGAAVVVAARDVIGDFPADLVAANAGYLEESPEAMRAFFRVADRANTYVRQNTSAAATDLSKILNMSPAVVLRGLKETPNMDKAYSLQVDPAALQTLSSMLVANGVIERPVNWATLLDQSYLPQDARAQV